MFGAMGSGKTFRNKGKTDSEYNPLIELPLSDDEEAAQASLQSVVKLIKQGFPRIPHSPTPPPSSPPPHTPSPTPPPPLPPFSMANPVKIHVFKGLGNKDPDEFWLVVKVVWEAQGITDDHIKKETLVSDLQECALTRYIKYYTDNSTSALANIQTTLNKEFSRPKSEAQSIVGFDEITMRPGERPWELDHRLKCNICEANMNLTNGKHREWFVASLLPHLRVVLSQQKIGTQAESLEILMRLHETLMQDHNLGVQEIHAQLQNLFLEMQSLKNDRTVWP
jgi:hypothetical protein